MGDEEVPQDAEGVAGGLRDLSDDELPEVGPKDKPFPDQVLVFARADGRWDWHRKAPNGEIVYGSSQGYENKGDALAQAVRYHPNLTVQVVEADPEA